MRRSLEEPEVVQQSWRVCSVKRGSMKSKSSAPAGSLSFQEWVINYREEVEDDSKHCHQTAWWLMRLLTERKNRVTARWQVGWERREVTISALVTLIREI